MLKPPLPRKSQESRALELFCMMTRRPIGPMEVALYSKELFNYPQAYL